MTRFARESDTNQRLSFRLFPVSNPLFRIVALLLALGLTVPAQAQYISPYQFAEANVSQAKAAAIAKSKFGGKVLSVSKQNSNGKTVYKVKLLQDSGRVKIVTIDGTTGKASG